MHTGRVKTQYAKQKNKNITIYKNNTKMINFDDIARVKAKEHYRN